MLVWTPDGTGTLRSFPVDRLAIATASNGSSPTPVVTFPQVRSTDHHVACVAADTTSTTSLPRAVEQHNREICGIKRGALASVCDSALLFARGKKLTRRPFARTSLSATATPTATVAAATSTTPCTISSAGPEDAVWHAPAGHGDITSVTGGGDMVVVTLESGAVYWCCKGAGKGKADGFTAALPTATTTTTTATADTPSTTVDTTAITTNASAGAAATTTATGEGWEKKRMGIKKMNEEEIEVEDDMLPVAARKPMSSLTLPPPKRAKDKHAGIPQNVWGDADLFAERSGTTAGTQCFRKHGVFQGGDFTLSPLSIAAPTWRRYQVGAVAVGRGHCLLVTLGGADVFSFGHGAHGQLGHGDIQSRWREPGRVEALDGLWVEQVECGGWHSCVLTKHGALYTFGRNHRGQLGRNTTAAANAAKRRRRRRKKGSADGTASSFAAAAPPLASVAAAAAATTAAPPPAVISEIVVPECLPGLVEDVAGTVLEVVCGNAHTAVLLGNKSAKGESSDKGKKKEGKGEEEDTSGSSSSVSHCGIVWAWGDNTHGQVLPKMATSDDAAYQPDKTDTMSTPRAIDINISPQGKPFTALYSGPTAWYTLATRP